MKAADRNNAQQWCGAHAIGLGAPKKIQVLLLTML